MERVASKAEARLAAAEALADGKTVTLVPTMGALHDGHLSLVRAARARAGYVVVSVFVNPTQFGPGEDYELYPRDLARDLELLGAEGVDLAFTPSERAMYEPDASVTVDPGPLAERWEGEARPGHFTGVATVVTKLLSIVRPSLAFFGEKDYQQLQIVRRLVRDLDLGTTIVGAPVVRDRDGLALSSRNECLSPPERFAARAIPAALEAAAESVARGARNARDIEREMYRCFGDREEVELEYAVVVDPETLEPLERLNGVGRVLIAARVGPVRLIDTCELASPSESTEERGSES
ncbi:MAG: pantoate--beta-alanine ligase [Coriobacteriia bacterium]|jgi:pantoate--beta-alanine ligase|nr:pantoate--beta-alanine ligase [Coriobacteriia bacterium]